jgi:hypothetical protein
LALDTVRHSRVHEGSFSAGLEERPRHPEAAPRGRFSRGVEQTGETHEKAHEGSFSAGLEARPRHPEAEPKRRFSEGLEEKLPLRMSHRGHGPRSSIG